VSRATSPALQRGEAPAPRAADRQSIARAGVLFLIAAVLLGAAHVVLSLLWPALMSEPSSVSSPSSPASQTAALPPVVNLALYISNLFVVASILLGVRARRIRTFFAYAIGYLVIVWLLWPLIRLMSENLLLLALAA